MLDLRPLCDLEIRLEPPLELGSSLRGRRRVIPIIGGAVLGARLRGEVLPGGADWQTVYEDGTAQLEARYTLRLEDDALIDVANFGYRHGPADVLAALARGEAVDPQSYYMRTTPRFETGDPRHAWLNRTLFVATGARLPDAVRLSVFEIL
jgi:Protein of unknown function (DUF3237)